METIFLLIPLALVLVVAIIWFFLWAVRTDQFDDLEGPAHRILMDDDDAVSDGGLPNFFCVAAASPG